MKKVLIVFCLIMSVLSYPTKASAPKPISDAKKGIPYEYTPKEGSI